MKKILINILGISHSQTQNGAYAVVLSEEEGNRELPIIINANDAQSIALKLEGIKPQRPLTHDLFKSFGDSFGIDLQEVHIYNLVEGIFYTKLKFTNDVEIESTIGDALALALCFSSEIYVNEFVIDSAGIEMDESGHVTNDKPKAKKIVATVADLENMLQKALADENYEVAAQLRDKIGKMKQNIE